MVCNFPPKTLCTRDTKSEVEIATSDSVRLFELWQFEADFGDFGAF